MKALYPRSCYWHYANNANWISIWQLNCFNLFAKNSRTKLVQKFENMQVTYNSPLLWKVFFFIWTISGLFCSPEKTNSLHSQLDRRAWLLHSSHLFKNVKKSICLASFIIFFVVGKELVLTAAKSCCVRLARPSRATSTIAVTCQNSFQTLHLSCWDSLS